MRFGEDRAGMCAKYGTGEVVMCGSQSDNTGLVFRAKTPTVCTKSKLTQVDLRLDGESNALKHPFSSAVGDHGAIARCRTWKSTVCSAGGVCQAKKELSCICVGPWSGVERPGGAGRSIVGETEARPMGYCNKHLCAGVCGAFACKVAAVMF